MARERLEGENPRRVFSGIVEARVPVRSWTAVGAGGRLVLPAPRLDWAVADGESVAVSGCCLTVAGLQDPVTGRPLRSGTHGADMAFELSAETLERTWFARGLAPGRWIALERSLRLSDRLGGHLVLGHVDGCGWIVSIEDSHDGGLVFVFEVPGGFERYLVEKGSVAVDGISLTVVRPAGNRFGVAVIPTTLAVTHLGEARVAQEVHLEADMIGKWIERMVAARMPTAS